MYYNMYCQWLSIHDLSFHMSQAQNIWSLMKVNKSVQNSKGYPYSVPKSAVAKTIPCGGEWRPNKYDSSNEDVKLRAAHVPGMSGTFSLPPRVSDPDMHHGTCVTHVPWCMPVSLTSGFHWGWWRGKHFRHSWRMRNPQFWLFGERPITLEQSWYGPPDQCHHGGCKCFSVNYAHHHQQ